MDDVKATTLKKRERKVKIKYNFTVYGDEHKQELNLDRCTNPVVMPVLGRVMLYPPDRNASLISSPPQY